MSEVIVRPTDSLESLRQKVKYATILGTMQSTLTDFRYIRKVWRDNIEEERLLGVSFTGIMDHPVLSKTGGILESWLGELKLTAVETNQEWAEKLGIPYAKQITLVKPSGTVSQLCGTASGIHPRYSRYYIRRVRQDVKDPLTKLMIDQKVPFISEGEKVIFEFPIMSPDDSVLQEDMTALDQLKLWKTYRDHWCHGNPSQTIYYTDDEYFEVADWIWNNWDSIGGLSFFPIDDHIYENAPYEKIDEYTYDKLVMDFPTGIDWSLLPGYETQDYTTGAQELACSGTGGCEI